MRQTVEAALSVKPQARRGHPLVPMDTLNQSYTGSADRDRERVDSCPSSLWQNKLNRLVVLAPFIVLGVNLGMIAFVES